MENLGYYNGTYDLVENMTIPMNDRVSWFGDGVYEATYSRNHKIFALDEHIDRLYNSAGLLDINPPCTKKEMKATLQEMVDKVDCGEQFVYWQLTRATQPRLHVYSDDAKANFWIMLRPQNIQPLDQELNVITLEDTRFLHCNIKTLNLIPAVMANQAAKRAGCDEAILHRGETVTECAHSNVHILKDGILKTHPCDHYILPGIARAHLIAMCKKHGVPVDETPFTLDELFDADEVIITSSGSFCMRVATIDGKPVAQRASETVKTLQDSLLAEFMASTE